MTNALTLLFLLGGSPVAGAAEPGDMAAGIGLGVFLDLPDKVSGEYARFGPGPGIAATFRYSVAEHARLRAMVRGDFGTGRDRVSWEQEINGEVVHFYDDDHFAALLSASLSAGMDLSLPIDAPVAPFFGADLGLALVTTYHSLGGRTQVLLDPVQNDLDRSGNIDPYTTQPTFLTDLHLGLDVPLSDGLALSAETGYSIAFLNARSLKKTPEELAATRDAYGLNAIRLAAGVVFLF